MMFDFRIQLKMILLLKRALLDICLDMAGFFEIDQILWSFQKIS
jgi:hypothetical protein